MVFSNAHPGGTFCGVILSIVHSLIVDGVTIITRAVEPPPLILLVLLIWPYPSKSSTATEVIWCEVHLGCGPCEWV